MHVHVQCGDGDAKFWLEPGIELAENYGLNSRQISTARRLVEEHADEIRHGWQDHFRS
jgi:hypothetical protein